MDLQQFVAAAVKSDPAKLVHASLDWGNIGALVTAVGALGFAAFGVVEALGKAVTFTYTLHGEARARAPRSMRVIRVGLPYVGFRAIRQMTHPFDPALECAFGENFMELIAQQYRSDRSTGRAPDMVREGVKLGLPFLPVETASRVIQATWKMDAKYANELAQALQSDNGAAAGATPPPDELHAHLLAGRFATALDERVNAAFLLAEAQYEAYAKMFAGLAAVVLALAFNLGLGQPLSWLDAFLVGVVAVPLAPVAKDLSTSLQNAMTAFKSIPVKRA